MPNITFFTALFAAILLGGKTQAITLTATEREATERELELWGVLPLTDLEKKENAMSLLKKKSDGLHKNFESKYFAGTHFSNRPSKEKITEEDCITMCAYQEKLLAELKDQLVSGTKLDGFNASEWAEEGTKYTTAKRSMTRKTERVCEYLKGLEDKKQYGRGNRYEQAPNKV